MTWVRLDDGFTRHPRMVAAGLHGRALFIAGLCYCGTHLTDGRIPKAALPMLAAEAGVKSSTWQKLLEVGSWVDLGDEIEVHDYLVYNPSREKVVGDRDAAAERQRKSRESRQNTPRDSPVSHTVTDAVTSPAPTRPVPLVPTEQETLAPATPGAVAVRRRDLLFEAFAEEVGHTPRTKVERGTWNAALKQLRDAEATPEQVHHVCDEHRRQWPSASLTLPSVAKHFGRLLNGRSQPVMSRNTSVVADWQKRTEGFR